MLKRIITIMAIVMFGMVSAASAMVTISDVGITANSLTFTIDGDMTGYVGTPYQPRMFSVEYFGDIFDSNLPYSVNSGLDNLIFDNEPIQSEGYTGYWDNQNYSWINHDATLLNAVATNNTVTLTMGNNYLDPTKTGTINFLWGHPAYTNVLLESIDYAPAPVPIPPTLLLFGSSLIGMATIGRKKFFK